MRQDDEFGFAQFRRGDVHVAQRHAAEARFLKNLRDVAGELRGPLRFARLALRGGIAAQDGHQHVLAERADFAQIAEEHLGVRVAAAPGGNADGLDRVPAGRLAFRAGGGFVDGDGVPPGALGKKRTGIPSAAALEVDAEVGNWRDVRAIEPEPDAAAIAEIERHLPVPRRPIHRVGGELARQPQHLRAFDRRHRR